MTSFDTKRFGIITFSEPLQLRVVSYVDQQHIGFPYLPEPRTYTSVGPEMGQKSRGRSVGCRTKPDIPSRLNGRFVPQFVTHAAQQMPSYSITSAARASEGGGISLASRASTEVMSTRKDAAAD